MLFLNQKGFSTVELLITLGFLGAVIYGGISVLEEQKKQIIQANQEIQMTAITHDLRQLLKRREQCQRSLQGLNPNTSADKIKHFYQKEQGAFSPTNSWVHAYSNEDILKISQGAAQLGIKSYSLNDSDIEVGPEDKTTELIIKFNRGSLLDNEIRYPTKKIKLFYELNTQGEIRTCSLTPLKKESPYWKINTLKKQLIYSGEALGIALNSPEADLDIQGPFLLRPVQAQLSLTNCSPEQQGQIISLGNRRRIFYCDSRLWRLLAP
jgi:hypothetical protein